MWAASSLWKKSLVEYFNCDSSSYMNKLSELIVRGGSINKPFKLEGVKYKRNFAQDGKVNPHDLKNGLRSVSTIFI